MVVYFCKTLEAEKLQANARWMLGHEPFDLQKADAMKVPGCHLISAYVTLRSQVSEIRPFKAWSTTYDPNAPGNLAANYNGRILDIPASLRLQEVIYYYAFVRNSRGQAAYGWIEIPERPAVLAYLNAQGKR